MGTADDIRRLVLRRKFLELRSAAAQMCERVCACMCACVHVCMCACVHVCVCVCRLKYVCGRVKYTYALPRSKVVYVLFIHVEVQYLINASIEYMQYVISV